MSMDTVNDLHAAEDLALGLQCALDDLLQLTRDETVGNATLAAMPDDETRDRYLTSRRHALAWVERWNEYCRPTCGANGEPDSDECSDDTCGCPCGHRDA